jgi:PD-(D/E)XK endonuclease
MQDGSPWKRVHRTRVQRVTQTCGTWCGVCHRLVVMLARMKPSAPTRLEAPEPSAHPVDVGLRTEAAILSELVRRGYQVLVPFGINQRYDLVLDVEGKFVRAQCKTGRLKKGVVLFSARSVRSNTRKTFYRSYSGEVELFLVHCPETNRIYAVPVDEVPACQGSLRVGPARNGQDQGIRWASDYELPG